MSATTPILSSARTAMDRALDNTRKEFVGVRSGKASPSMLDSVRVDHVVYLENLAFNLFLALMFAITLWPGREALVTRLARTARHGDMPDAVVGYTRAITAAWALYFVAIALVSTVLFFAQPRETWSLFINVLVWPLTATMFVAEYAVRLRVLRGLDHISLIATMRAYMHRARG